MPKIKDKTYSEEIDIPFEIFQSYFQEKRRLTFQYRLLTFQYRLAFGAIVTFSIILSAGLLAGLVALPFLLLTISGPIFAAFGTVFLGTFVAMAVLGIFFSSKWLLEGLSVPQNENNTVLSKILKTISFKKEGIKFSLLNSSSCIFTPRGENTHIEIKSNGDKSFPKATQRNILIILKDVKKVLKSKQNTLMYKKEQIISSINNNLKENIKALSMLDKELRVLDAEIERNAKNLEVLDKVIADIICEITVEEDCFFVVSQLSSFLKEKKEYMHHFSLEEAEAKQKIEALKQEDLKCSERQVKDAISKEIAKIKTDLSAKKINLKKEASSMIESIKKAKADLYAKNKEGSVRRIEVVKYSIRQVNVYLQSASEAVLQISPSLFLEFYPEQATQHYSSLLNNPATQTETLEFLKKLLADYPQSDNQANQAANYILANHFLSQLKIHKTEALRAQACQAVLRLSSSDENNSNLKEAIILYAFYEKENLSSLPADIIELVKYSHIVPQVYDTLKQQIEGLGAPKPVQFSNSAESSSDASAKPLETESTVVPSKSDKVP